MAVSVAQKLRIKEGFTLLTLHAPENFESHLQPLPAGVTISTEAISFNQIHWFVTSKAELEKDLDHVLGLVNNEIICWIYYPKGTSKIQTDLTRDKGWDKLTANQQMQWLTLISFDSTWSTFGFRRENDADKKKQDKPKVREIFNYVNPETKEVRLPEDLAALFRENKTEERFFNTLSFTNKKEYVEWIVTAKREETRKQRLQATIEKLGKGWKNPNNM